MGDIFVYKLYVVFLSPDITQKSKQLKWVVKILAVKLMVPKKRLLKMIGENSKKKISAV